MQVSIIPHTLLDAPMSEHLKFKFHSNFCRYTKPHHKLVDRSRRCALIDGSIDLIDCGAIDGERARAKNVNILESPSIV